MFTRADVQEAFYRMGLTKPNYPVPATESVNLLAMPYERLMPVIKYAIVRELTHNLDYWARSARY